MFELKNQGTCLQLSAKSGAVLGMSANGKNLTGASDRAFRIRLLDPAGDAVTLDDRDFADFSFDGKELLQWSGCGKFPGLTMALRIRPAEHGSFRFRPSLSGIPADLRPELMSAPLLALPLDSELLLPQSEGALYHYSGAVGEEWDEHFSFPGNCNHYPGMCQMQFLAASADHAGIYFAADDFGHATKFFGTTHRAGEKTLEAHIECCCGTNRPDLNYELPFDMILRPFVGDWQNACEIYREWVEHDPAMKRDFPLPGWMDESPVVIIYPVRGEKSISDKPNRFLPYENTFPRIQELAKQLNSKVMVLLMRWDHNGPWMPPYYWPPVGGAESFRKFRDLLHGAGHLLGVYGSGTYFTRKSLLNDYTADDIFEREHLADAMVTGPHGEMERTFQTIRTGTAFCITEDAGRKIIAEQTRILADEKVDFFQFLDQNLGGAPFPCYSPNHRHPSIPGREGTDAMRDFLHELNAMIRARGSSMILGTECAAAGPFIADLPFNDLRSHAIETDWGGPVPAYQYIFHRHLNNFFGNGCVAPNHTDNDCLRFRFARGFCGGSMMTIVLRDSGEIDWGASVCEWSEPAPDQQSIITLVRNLNEARRRWPEFLRDGDMIPAPEIECATRDFSVLRRGKIRTVPEIVCSAWRAPDGRQAAFFVNYQTEEKTFRRNGKTYAVPPLSVIMTEA
ncbi:MAG: hypothetical protein IJS14_06645 [Lentisphaeria bacterium]|nr:hypothetical protein [Lentisphaeria bacterium]